MIAKTERAEATGNPAQSFAGEMRVARTRIGCAHNFAKQNERGISETVFFQD